MKRHENVIEHQVKPFPQRELQAPSFASRVVGSETPEIDARPLNKFFKALSDETRRKILLLLEHRDHTVGEIVDRFNLSQPTISRHLAVLKEANLVTDQRKGQFVVYRLSGSAMVHFARAFFDEFSDCRTG